MWHILQITVFCYVAYTLMESEPKANPAHIILISGVWAFAITASLGWLFDKLSIARVAFVGWLLTRREQRSRKLRIALGKRSTLRPPRRLAP